MKRHWAGTLSLVLFALLATGGAVLAAPNAERPGTGTEGLGSAATDDPFGKYAPPITMSVVKSTLNEIKFPSGDNWDNNVWTREIEETLGIKLNNLWAVDGSLYWDKLRVSIASGDLPDIINCGSAELAMMAQAGLIADLGPVYEAYASPELRGIMDAFPEGMAAGRIGGKLMAISEQGWGIISSPAVVWIRDDWMRKLNFTAPKSMDDITAMADAFVNRDPDGNNKADTYGVAVNKNLWDDLESLKGFFNAFHAYPKTWFRDASGAIVNGSVQPEMKAGIRLLQDWYKRGILDKEFGVKDTNKVNEDIVSGKVGIEFGANWNCYWPFLDLVKKDVNAIWKPYEIPSADGKPVMLRAGWPISNYMAVSKNCANPEAAIRILNLYVKKAYYGTEDDFHTFDTDQSGVAVRRMAPFAVCNPNKDYDGHVRISAALDRRDPSGLTLASERTIYASALTWLEDKNPDGYGYYYQMSSEGAYSILRKFVDEKRLVITMDRGIETPTMIERGSTLDAMRDDTITHLIMGAPLDQFDKFVADWKKLGGDDITREMQQAYAGQ